jgi:hypothetical protein
MTFLVKATYKVGTNFRSRAYLIIHSTGRYIPRQHQTLQRMIIPWYTMAFPTQPWCPRPFVIMVSQAMQPPAQIDQRSRTNLNLKLRVTQPHPSFDRAINADKVEYGFIATTNLNRPPPQQPITHPPSNKKHTQ